MTIGNPIYRFLLLLALALIITLGLSVTAHAVEIVQTEGTALNLEVNKGQVVRLDRPTSTVFLANPEIADVQLKSPTLIYVYAKRPGQTTMYAVDDGDNILADLRITVRHNLSALREAMQRVAPDALVDVESVNGTLLLTGTVGSASAAEDLRQLVARFATEKNGVINKMRVDAPNQVDLRVRIAEVSRSAVKELGFNWDAIFSSGSFVFGLATGNPVVAAGSFLTRGGSTGSANSIFGSASNGSYDVNGLIDALADEGVLSILAEPNLTAMSGESGSFLAGGEFPIPVPQENSSITIEFKKFGVQLVFTPVILEGGRISLRVNPEVSELTTNGAININGFAIPALTTRRADTTVELGSGQSLAIAGLLKNNVSQDISKLPGLGDLPVLGQLFRSDTYRHNESELVIIITPYIVRPVSARQLALPTDGLIPPTDADRLLRGRNYGEASPDRNAATSSDEEDVSLAGPVGFMLE
jgi:pilus assembly protein CpaC